MGVWTKMTAHHDLSDDALIHRIHEGDEHAFEVLFGRYAQVLRARVKRMLSPALLRKISVSDVLQEGRIVALRRFAEFESREPGSVRKWLTRIVELKLKEAVRKHTRTVKRAAVREVSRGGRAETAQFAARQPTPSELLVGAEQKEMARQAFASLPDDYQEVLRLTREERLTLRQAAERMGRSREATKKLYGRAAARYAHVFAGMRGGRDV